MQRQGARPRLYLHGTDGYDVLLGHIKRVFDTTNGLTWEESVSVYVKPTNHAPQKDSFSHAAFVLMLYVYVSRPRAQRLTSLRRATDGRIQEQLLASAYMREHSIEGGPASQRYAAVSQARLPMMHLFRFRITLR
ncbi:hypothetical protein GQ600_7639 [Phytophthora cactorum]|nr:hypothetical protein GQ600_7639 [Phytophthora cactorum]